MSGQYFYKKAQVLIIFLWILVVLTILAISIGYRASTTLRFSHYLKERLKALYLAKAGINRAIAELEKDTNSYDTLNEPWADNKEIFEKIMLSENQNEFATVSYIDEENEREETRFGVIDEERKININFASQQILISLLEECNVNAPGDIAKNIIIWRGDLQDDNRIYEGLGYSPKAAKFVNIEELMLVGAITAQDYQKSKELITVYTDGLVNINTISDRVLKIIAKGIAKKLNIGENFAENIAGKIIALRNSNNGYFQEKNDINISPTGDEELNLFNELMQNITVQSNNFLIEATGFENKLAVKVKAVYSRKDKKILYWYES